MGAMVLRFRLLEGLEGFEDLGVGLGGLLLRHGFDLIWCLILGCL